MKNSRRRYNVAQHSPAPHSTLFFSQFPGKTARLLALAIVALIVSSFVFPAEKAHAHSLGTSGNVRGDTATYTVTGEEGNYTLTIKPKDDGTGTIPAYAFYNDTTNQELSGIKTIIIEEGITSIGESAFHKNVNNAEFTSLTIPASVTTISKNAFYDCSSLASVTIAGGSQLTSIGDGAFNSCGFSSIALPCPNLASIGKYAFSTTQNNKLGEIICLTETALSVNNDMFYGNSKNKVTVYMLGSHKVSWNLAAAVKSLVSSIVQGEGVSSMTADYSNTQTKTVNGTNYYVGGSTIELTLASSLTGDVVFRANDTQLTVDSDGKATLTLPGNADTVTITALIPISITGAAVTPAETECTYDGSPKTPTGKGSYGNSASAAFKIIPPAIEGLTYNKEVYYFDIKDSSAFNALAEYANGGGDTKYRTFKLTADIGSESSPAGSSITPLNKLDGTFDGGGHTIYGLSITTEQEGNAGLFALGYGVIKNLTLADVTVSAPNGVDVGAVVGFGPAKIENCHVTWTVSGKAGVGGIIGWAGINVVPTEDTGIQGCTFSGSVSGSGGSVGGIIGGSNFHNAKKYTISGCVVTDSEISGLSMVGGIVGQIQSSSTSTSVFDCKAGSTTVSCNSGGYRGVIVGNNFAETTTERLSGCVYHYGDSGVKGTGAGTDTGCTLVYAVSHDEYSTAAFSSGETEAIGGETYYKTDAVFTLGHTEKTGYEFTGWTVKDIDGVDVAVEDGKFTLGEKDVVVTAEWRAVRYTLTYELADGQQDIRRNLGRLPEQVLCAYAR